MKSEKPVFTDFNFSFNTFPRQVFVNNFDDEMKPFFIADIWFWSNPKDSYFVVSCKEISLYAIFCALYF